MLRLAYRPYYTTITLNEPPGGTISFGEGEAQRANVVARA
jgi:hypothetical protein